MNEASVNLLKQNNGMKEIFSSKFFLRTFQSYHPLRENAPYMRVTFILFEIFGMSGHTKFVKIDETGFKLINNQK